MNSGHQREFRIGGLRVEFEDTGQAFRLISEGTLEEKSALNQVITDAVQRHELAFNHDLDSESNLIIPYPGDVVEGLGLLPQARVEDLLQVLEELQDRVRSRAVLQSRKRNLDRESVDYFAQLVERQSEEKSAPYLNATLAYLESIGQPLSDAHKVKLKSILAATYAKGDADRSF